MGFTLDKIVPLGRSYDEYVSLFGLTESTAMECWSSSLSNISVMRDAQKSRTHYFSDRRRTQNRRSLYASASVATHCRHAQRPLRGIASIQGTVTTLTVVHDPPLRDDSFVVGNPGIGSEDRRAEE